MACAVVLAVFPTWSRAQGAAAPAALDPVVVTATRTPVPLSRLGSAVDVVTPGDVAREQLATLGQALGGMAGAPIRTGGTGGATSLFLRGSNSLQTVVLVDGIRVSDANTLYANFLGGASMLGPDRVEVVRGPQSTIYGADAIGGVVALTTTRGAGDPTVVVSAEGGSFATGRAGLAAQGERGNNAYQLAVSGLTTANDRANNDFESASAALRLDHQFAESVSVGATLRAYRGKYGSPGAAVGFGANDPDNFEREANVLATVFAEWSTKDDWSGRVTLGVQDRDYRSVNPTPPFASETSFRTTRGVLDAQSSYAGWGGHRVTGGMTVEGQRFDSDGFGTPRGRTVDYALFVQDEWSVSEAVLLTAGLRRDQFDSFGGQTTGRATLAWQAVPGRLKARASYGTGFRAPSFLELYGYSPGTSFGYRGNPDLEPERARGGDVGLDWRWADGRAVMSVSVFQTDTEDLINGFAFVAGRPEPFTSVNVGEARSRGVEVGGRWQLAAGTTGRANYTYLESDDVTGGTRLLRRPRHAVTFDLTQDFGAGVTMGLGATAAADAVDVDAQTFATVSGEDYLVVRLHSAWAVNDRLTLTARVENLLDEEYAVVNGYPSLGMGGFLGAQWRF